MTNDYFDRVIAYSLKHFKKLPDSPDATKDFDGYCELNEGIAVRFVKITSPDEKKPFYLGFEVSLDNGRPANSTRVNPQDCTCETQGRAGADWSFIRVLTYKNDKYTIITTK